MDELSSKLCKNENNANISLYQIYLLKFCENILKYSRLNLFKEIAISSHHSLEMTLESPTSLYDNLLV